MHQLLLEQGVNIDADSWIDLDTLTPRPHENMDLHGLQKLQEKEAEMEYKNFCPISAPKQNEKTSSLVFPAFSRKKQTLSIRRRNGTGTGIATQVINPGVFVPGATDLEPIDLDL